MSKIHVPQGIDPARVDERARLLLDHAKELMAAGVLPADTVDLREYRFRSISEGYFLLNNAYKHWRMPDGHNTELPKIAALQCVLIVKYQPFFPLVHPVNEADPVAAKPNEIFACSYALGILGIKFRPDKPEREDFWLRLLDVLTSVQAQTLEPYTSNHNLRIDEPLGYYESVIQTVHADDKPAISALICIFELMSKKRSKLIPGLFGRMFRL